MVAHKTRTQWLKNCCTEIQDIQNIDISKSSKSQGYNNDPSKYTITKITVKLQS